MLVPSNLYFRFENEFLDKWSSGFLGQWRMFSDTWILQTLGSLDYPLELVASAIAEDLVRDYGGFFDAKAGPVTVDILDYSTKKYYRVSVEISKHVTITGELEDIDFYDGPPITLSSGLVAL